MTVDIIALKEEAQSVYKMKDYAQAGNLFDSAANQAIEQGQELDAAELKNNASVSYLLAGDFQAAYDAVMGTEQIFLAAGNRKLYGMALGNQAAALEELGHKNEALALYEQSADVLKEAGEKELRAYILKRISAIQVTQGRHLEALGSMNTALENTAKLAPKEKVLKKLSNFVQKLIQR